MLPFVVGGGILIALAFLIDGLCVDMNALSAADRGNFGTITPVAAQLKTIGGSCIWTDASGTGWLYRRSDR